MGEQLKKLEGEVSSFDLYEKLCFQGHRKCLRHMIIVLKSVTWEKSWIRPIEKTICFDEKILELEVRNI